VCFTCIGISSLVGRSSVLDVGHTAYTYLQDINELKIIILVKKICISLVFIVNCITMHGAKNVQFDICVARDTQCPY